MKIVIFSKEIDVETNRVMDWLESLDQNVSITRINGISSTSGIQIDFNDGVFIGELKIADFNSVWLRKYPDYSIQLSENSELSQKISTQITNEGQAIYRAFNNHLINVNTIGSKKPLDNNKLDNLMIAKSVGLSIPESRIISNKNELKKFMEKAPDGIIVKPISNAIFIQHNGSNYGMYTEEINQDNIQELSVKFHPSLFQFRIKRRYEIRAYFLKNEIYASAIFNTEQTDIRKDKSNSISRIVPIQLDEKLERSIKLFMKAVELDSGSLDLIVDHQGNTYFLEVNPFGQIAKYSDACNYNIEKQIALKLLEK